VSQEDRQQERIVDYLLGELDAVEAASFELQLETDAVLRREVDRLRPTVGQLQALPGSAWDPPEPPPLQPVPVPPVAPVAAPPPARRRLRWTRPQLALAGAASAFALAIGVGIGVWASGDDGASETATPSGPTVVLRPIGPRDRSAQGELTLARDGVANLRVRDLTPNGRNYYEVWLMGDQGLVSLGSFRVGPTGEADIGLSLPVDPRNYRAFDISLEPDNGDPAHSTDSVLRGPT
jgi:anti-sigma-K factor RskA